MSSKPIGIWVTGKHGSIGWVHEEDGTPTTFKTLVDAKLWIKENVIHKEQYEAKTYQLPPTKRRKPKQEEDIE